MEYNKNQFKKIDDKKLLHKIGKKWVVISAFMLFALGGSISSIMPHAHADTSNNNQTKAQLNQKSNQTKSIQSNQSHQSVNNQAKALHAQIINNNAQNRIRNYVNGINNQFNQSKQNNNASIIHNSSVDTNNNHSHTPILLNKQNNSNQNNLTTIQPKQISTNSVSASNNGYVDSRGYYHAPYSDFHRTAQYDYNSSTQTLTIHDGTLVVTGARTSYWTPYVNNYGVVKHIDLERAVAPSDSHSLFDYNPNLQSVTGYMDTSQANNINYLFLSDVALSDISALSHWNTHNVVNMQKAFGVNSNTARGCQSLKNLDAIKNWDVSNVQNMDNMFSNCTSLTNINGIRNWYTPNLNQASYMFDDDYNLTNVDLSNWVIDKSGPMNAMFGSDSKLVYINLGPNTHFDYDSAPAGRDIGPTDTRNINITLADDCAGHGWKSVAGANKGQIINNNDSNGGDRLVPNNTWINLKNAVPSAPLNFIWHNPITNQNINGTNDSISGFDGMKINANDYVPVGYKLDPTQNYNSNQTNFTLSNNTQNVTLNVIPNNIKTYGHWGSAHWTLDYSNDLDISDGQIGHSSSESNAIPIDVQEETKHVNLHNVSPSVMYGIGDFSGLFNNANSDRANATWSGGTTPLYYKNLESCNLSNINGAKIGTFKMMFLGDRNLKTVNGLNQLSTSNPGNYGLDFSGMFWDCSNLSNVTFDGGQTIYPYWLGHTFQSDTNLKSIDISEFDTSHSATHSGVSDDYTFGSIIQNDPNLVYVKLGQNTQILSSDRTVRGQPANKTTKADAPDGWKSIQGNNEGTLVKDGNLLSGNTWINVKNATEAAPLNISFQDQNNNSIGTPQVFKGYVGQNVNISNIIPAGYQMIPRQKTNYTLTNQTQNAVVKVNVKTVAQGYWGQCKWTLDSFGDLSIDGNGSNNNMEYVQHPSSLDQTDSNTSFANGINKNGTFWKDITTLNFNDAVAPTAPDHWTYNMFEYMPELRTINGGLDTSHMNGLNAMFFSDSKLNNINGLANWNVSNVTGTNRMFVNDKNLSDFSPLRNWDLSVDNNFANMFENTSIKSFDLPNFKTGYKSDLTALDGAFQSDSDLTSIDFSNINNKKALDDGVNVHMGSFLLGDHKLIYVKLGSDFVLPGKTGPGSYLYSAQVPAYEVLQQDAPQGWKSIAGKNIGTTITNGQLLPGNTWLNIANAKQASPLNISYIDQNGVQIKTTQVNGYVGMPVNVINLTPKGYQIASGQKTNYMLSSQVQNIAVRVNTKIVNQGLWGQCHWYLDSLGNLDIVGNGNQNNMQTANHPSAMDGNNNNIQFAPSVKKNGSLWKDIKTLNFKNAVAPVTIDSMFRGMSDLTTINKGLDTSNSTSAHEIFQSDKKLTDINGLADWDIKKMTNLSWFFQSDLSLADVSPISHWSDHNSGLIMGRFFDNCPSLVNVDIPHFNIIAGNNWDDFEFANNTSLRNLDISGWDNHLTTDTDSFLAGDRNLLFIKLNPNFIPDARGIQTGEPFSKDASQDAIRNGTNYGWKSIAGKNIGTIVKNGQLLGGNTWINLANAVQAQPLTLNFKDQYGNKIGNPQKVNGYVGQKVNVSNLAPTGYQIAPNQQLNYTLSNQPQSANIQVNVSTVAQGLWGQCHWLVDGLGDLDITGIGNQNDMQTANHPSAMDSNDNNVKFAPNVKKNGSLWKDINTINFNNVVAPSDSGDMFANMPDLIKINSGLNTSKVGYLGNTFSDDPKLNDINGLSNWDVSHAGGFGHIFAGDTSLTSFNMPNWHVGQNMTANAVDNLFSGDTALKSVDFSGFNLNGSNLDNLFGGSRSYSPEKFNDYNLDTNLTYMKLGPNFDLSQSVSDNGGSGTPIKQDLINVAPQGWESIAGNNVGDIVTDGNVLPNNTWLNIKNAPTAKPLNFTWHNTKNGQNVKGSNDNVTGNLGKKVNATNYLPSGYELDPSSKYNSNQINYMLNNNVQNITLNIVPIIKTDDIQFDLSGSNIPADNAGPTGIITSDKTDYSGNDSSATGAGNTNYTFSNSATNLKGMPAHYHVVGNQTVNYDGGTHKIEIAPDIVTDTVNYIYKGHGNTIYNGFHPQGVYDTHNTINWDDYGYNQMPTNWNISNDGTQNWIFNGESHNVNVQPNKASDTIYYQNNGVTKGQHIFYGNDSSASGASDTSFVIGKKPAGLPVGYHIINSDQSFSYNYNGKYNVAIAPNLVTQHINYWWFNRSVGSTNIKGLYDSTGTINGTGLNPGWHANNSATFNDTDGNGHFIFNGGTTTIGVLPNTVTDHIHYIGTGVNIWKNFNGNDYRTGVDGSFTIGNNPTGLPKQYHVINPNQSFNYDGGNHDVPVTRNKDTIKINYINQNNVKVNTNTSSNTVNSINNVITWPTTAPRGYFIDGGQEANHTIQNSDVDSNYNLAKGDFNADGSHDIYVTGDKANLKINFINNTTHQFISSDNFNGTNAIGDTLSDIAIPKGYVPYATMYKYDNSHNTFDYEFKPSDIDKSQPMNSNTVTMNLDTIQLQPVQASVHVRYVDASDNKVVYTKDIHGFIGLSGGRVTDSLRLPNIHNLSRRYSLINNQQLNYVFKPSNMTSIQVSPKNYQMKDYTIYVHRNKVSQLKVIYLDSDEKQIGKSDTVSGDIGDKLEILNYGDIPTNNPDLISYAPSGCHINNETVVLTNMESKDLYVRANRDNVTNTVNIIQVVKNSDGSNIVKSISRAFTGYRGEYETLNANDYLNNLSDSSNYEVNPNTSSKAVVSLTSDSSTNPDNVIFYYQAKSIKNAKLTIHLMNHGRIIKTLKPILSQLGNTINNTQIKNDIGQLPKGYTIDNVNSGVPNTYTFSNTNDNMYVNLKGKSIPNAQKFTIYQIEENLDGTINVIKTPITINTNVGSDTLITPYSNVPKGYHAINGNASFDVHYNSDGTLEPINSIDYLYGQNYIPNNNKIGKIRVHYVTNSQLSSGFRNDNSGIPNLGEIDEESDSGINKESFNINPYLEDIPEEIDYNYDLDNPTSPTSNIVNNIGTFNDGVQDIYIKIKNNQDGLIVLS